MLCPWSYVLLWLTGGERASPLSPTIIYHQGGAGPTWNASCLPMSASYDLLLQNVGETST